MKRANLAPSKTHKLYQVCMRDPSTDKWSVVAQFKTSKESQKFCKKWEKRIGPLNVGIRYTDVDIKEGYHEISTYYPKRVMFRQ